MGELGAQLQMASDKLVHIRTSLYHNEMEIKELNGDIAWNRNHHYTETEPAGCYNIGSVLRSVGDLWTARGHLLVDERVALTKWRGVRTLIYEQAQRERDYDKQRAVEALPEPVADRS